MNNFDSFLIDLNQQFAVEAVAKQLENGETMMEHKVHLQKLFNPNTKRWQNLSHFASDIAFVKLKHILSSDMVTMCLFVDKKPGTTMTLKKSEKAADAFYICYAHWLYALQNGVVHSDATSKHKKFFEQLPTIGKFTCKTCAQQKEWEFQNKLNLYLWSRARTRWQCSFMGGDCE